MTAEQLLEQYMDERQALGFVGKTDRDCIRRFLQDYENPEDGNVEFTKEYVLGHIGNRLNQKASTVQREASAINGFLDFVIRKGFTAYKVPRRSLPKQIRNFKAYIFSDDEIERMLNAADYIPPTEQNPLRHHQLPVMFRILFNCGLRSAELRELRVGDVDLAKNTLTIRDTKFHKNRIVPFSDSVADALTKYLEVLSPRPWRCCCFQVQRVGVNVGLMEPHGFKCNSNTFSAMQIFHILELGEGLVRTIPAIPSLFTALIAGCAPEKISLLHCRYSPAIWDMPALEGRRIICN